MSEQDNAGGGQSPAEARRTKLNQIEAMGLDPWGHRFDDRSMIGDIRERASLIKYRLEDGNVIELPNDLVTSLSHGSTAEYAEWLKRHGRVLPSGPKVRAAGRIKLYRKGGKTHFADIEDWTGKIQIFLNAKLCGDENWELIKCLDLGDLIGVDGELRRTKTGELSIFASKIHMLCKTLDPPPAKHMGLTDPEIRQRRRYIDLAWNEGVRERFMNRSKIVASIRQTLAEKDFVEIEGPTLHTIAGGAAARPFNTHHNALDMPLVMRIALELHLKRLMVGGMERVFELGRVYRNEGISPKHNPEFSMLEVYQAFGNYRSMMDLTQDIIQNAIETIGCGHVVPWGDKEIDFTPCLLYTSPSPRDRG